MSDGAGGKQERVYRVLRERVLDGSYQAGHRLVIDALAREMSVSPMPVREAIRRLEAEGWVTFQRNQGAQVAPVDAHAWADSMTTLAVLEGYATAAAAPFILEEDLDAMRRVNGELRAAVDELDVTLVSKLNGKFHGVISQRCPNRFLVEQMDQIHERLRAQLASIFIFIPTRGRVSADEHDHIVELLARRAPARDVERAARRHKLQTIEAYKRRDQPRDAQREAAASSSR